MFTDDSTNRVSIKGQMDRPIRVHPQLFQYRVRWEVEMHFEHKGFFLFLSMCGLTRSFFVYFSLINYLNRLREILAMMFKMG